MTKPVTLTQEQAEAMELYKKEGFDINDFEMSHEAWKGRYKSLKELDLNTFARAFLLPYEIAPTFNYGDLVMVEMDGEVEERVFKVSNVLEDSEKIAVYYLDNPILVPISSVRHLTEEELYAFKQKEIWGQLNRDVGEIHNGDVLLYKGNWCEVTDRTVDYAVKSWFAQKLFAEGQIKGFFPVESYVPLDTEGTE